MIVQRINLVLIDEPDSHIHSNLQVNMLNELQKEENIQSFVITHNDRLIDTILEEGSVLFINDELKSIGTIDPIDNENYCTIKEELANKLNEFAIDAQFPIPLQIGSSFQDLLSKHILITAFTLKIK